ncbi:hypothetical protein Psfp_03075 [Pelotomaculum sp. FP]|nr:hypothetical protein Psfp_03075 [Pelotomaculum sp. FP]
MSIYTSISSVSLLLCLMNLLSYTDIKTIVLFLLLLSEISLFFGVTFGDAIFNSVKGKTKRIQQNEEDSHSLIIKEVEIVRLSMSIIAIIATVGWTLSLREILRIYSLSYILADTSFIQYMDLQQQYIGYLNVMGILVFPMFVFCAFKDKVRILDIICVCLAMTGLFLAGIKSYLIITLVVGFFVYSQIAPKIKFRYILLLAFAGIAFFVFYTNIIDKYSVVNFGGSNFPEFLSIFQRPYLYITGGWASFSVAEASTGTMFPYKGYVVLAPIFKLISFLGLTDKEQFEPLEGVQISSYGAGTNVYTMVGEAYIDLGVVGCVFTFLFLGLICGYLYKLSCRYRKPNMIFVSALLMYVMFISFLNYYLNFKILFLCIVTYGVLKAVNFYKNKKRRRIIYRRKTTNESRTFFRQQYHTIR